MKNKKEGEDISWGLDLDYWIKEKCIEEEDYILVMDTVDFLLEVFLVHIFLLLVQEHDLVILAQFPLQ